jgi:DNA polymerase-3 subunit delta'
MGAVVPSASTPAPLDARAHPGGSSAAALPGIEAHPHARAVLGPAVPPKGSPSHAYLFHGPSGTGRRAVARAFAAELLADGASDPEEVRERVARGAHPDLTWVCPSGANEMLVGDIDEAVVGAAARTPFEASRRVFVIEGAHTMSDTVANRLLKTLEEPPSFVHLILVAHRLADVLPTVASRCLHVRFDPLPPERIEEYLIGFGEEGLSGSGEEELVGSGEEHAACARLAMGDASHAAWLLGEEGRGVRGAAEAFVRGALQGRTAERGWMALLERARAAGVSAGEEEQARWESEAELWDVKERRRRAREATEAARRVERRERTRTLDVCLRLAEAWLRDVWCIAVGAPEAVYAVDRLEELHADAVGRSPASLRAGVEAVAQWRLRLAVNVAEELALEALAYALQDLLASSAADALAAGSSSERTRRASPSRSETTAAR